MKFQAQPVSHRRFLSRFLTKACVSLVIAVALPLGAQAQPTTALPANDFLNSLGLDSTFPDRGQPLAKTVEMIKYGGFRWVRGGIEGLTDSGPTTLQTYLDLHKQTGVKFNWGLVSSGNDLHKLIETGKVIAQANALLAFEGNNEPNNWGVTYQGEKGGGQAPSWVPVAKLQRDLYRAVKSDPLLKKYPVWSPSETGGQTDNVGLQFLTIPPGAGTLMPEGTKYADFATCHNYIYHANSPDPMDNKTWNAADPSSACKVDGLSMNFGVTWAHQFRGYSEAQLATLPRVTTETGCGIDKNVNEEMQGQNLMSMYLDQFKRGWSYTAVYILRDRTDEAGNQACGFFKPDYSPRQAAVDMHNLTSILADDAAAAPATLSKLDYAIPDEPVTVHDMLLEKSDGTLDLLVWGERLKGADAVTVRLGAAYATVKVYDPTIGTDPIQTLSNVSSLNLTLTNHPLIIVIPKN